MRTTFMAPSARSAFLIFVIGCAVACAVDAATAAVSHAAAVSRAALNSPLLDLAASQDTSSLPNAEAVRRNLQAAEHLLANAKPPSEDCLQSLGAERYADLYAQAGEARASLGNYAGAEQAYRTAFDCQPRNFFHAYLLGEALLAQMQFDNARAVVANALSQEPKHYDLNSLQMRLDMIVENWPGVAEHANFLIQSERRKEQTPYWHIFQRLAAQRLHAALKPNPKNVLSDWPGPVLQYLDGAIPEKDLARVIARESRDARRHEMLCEALFYVGEQQLALGNRERARVLFATAVQSKILDFIEYQLARAELQKMRAAAESTTVARPLR